jgi:hypothetical protein
VTQSRAEDAASEPAEFLEAAIAAVADDDVIEHVDAEYLPGCCEPACDVEIVGRRRGIARRVIVRLMCPESLCAGASASARTSAVRRSKKGT